MCGCVFERVRVTVTLRVRGWVVDFRPSQLSVFQKKGELLGLVLSKFLSKFCHLYFANCKTKKIAVGAKKSPKSIFKLFQLY